MEFLYNGSGSGSTTLDVLKRKVVDLTGDSEDSETKSVQQSKRVKKAEPGSELLVIFTSEWGVDQFVLSHPLFSSVFGFHTSADYSTFYTDETHVELLKLLEDSEEDCDTCGMSKEGAFGCLLKEENKPVIGKQYQATILLGVNEEIEE